MIRSYNNHTCIGFLLGQDTLRALTDFEIKFEKEVLLLQKERYSGVHIYIGSKVLRRSFLEGILNTYVLIKGRFS